VQVYFAIDMFGKISFVKYNQCCIAKLSYIVFFMYNIISKYEYPKVYLKYNLYKIMSKIRGGYDVIKSQQVTMIMCSVRIRRYV